MKYKFRIWDKINKKMSYDMSLNPIYVTLNDFFDSGTLVFMRSFGHKDKNGKEIWQGDIIKTWSNTGETCFGGQTVVLGTVNFFTNPAFVEVVGNEWENPELVELR